MTNPDATTHLRHLVVEGRVQGVGFRWFARERARRLALRGWVRNRVDGSVEVTVAGPVRALDHFVGDLGVGPPGAAVKVVREMSESELHDAVASSSRPDSAGANVDLPFPFVIQR